MPLVLLQENWTTTDVDGLDKIKHRLNHQAKVEATDTSKRYTIKTKTGTGTVNEEGANSSSY